MILPGGCFTAYYFLRAVAIPAAHWTFTNCAQCVLRFTLEENGCERGDQFSAFTASCYIAMVVHR